MKKRPDSTVYPAVTRPELSDRWLKLLGVPLVAVLILTVSDYERMRNPEFLFSPEFPIRLLISLLITIMVWQGNLYIYKRLQQRLPWKIHPRRRIVIQALLSSGYTMLILAIPVLLIELYSTAEPTNITTMLVLGLVITVCMNAIYIGMYFFEQWIQSLTESEQLKRQSMESRFEALKNQVNPHFLFNSLNTLMTLIEEDPQLAVEFTQELSSVYRYVLQSRERELVSLETELRFVRSFAYLLQKRFDDNVQISIDVPTEYLKRSVLPLSLQMLIENAVKHNVVSAEHPLRISISANGAERLVVQNTVRRKNVSAASTKVGLQNIMDRYDYLSTQKVRIAADDTSFRVELPLLQEV